MATKTRRAEGFARVTLKNISRPEPKFYGWRVNVKRMGRDHVRYFADGADGPFDSLRAAIQWRDAEWLRLGPPSHTASRQARNTSGVIGVAYNVIPNGSGSYVASWLDADNKRHRRSFSIDKYGKDHAFQLAKAARRSGLRETRIARERRDLETLHAHKTLLASARP